MTDRLRYNLDATDAAEIRFLVDAETLGWLERESARTGISLEKIASAMLRKACNETPALVFGYRTAQKQLKLDAMQGGGRR